MKTSVGRVSNSRPLRMLSALCMRPLRWRISSRGVMSRSEPAEDAMALPARSSVHRRGSGVFTSLTRRASFPDCSRPSLLSRVLPTPARRGGGCGRVDYASVHFGRRRRPVAVAGVSLARGDRRGVPPRRGLPHVRTPRHVPTPRRRRQPPHPHRQRTRHTRGARAATANPADPNPADPNPADPNPAPNTPALNAR